MDRVSRFNGKITTESDKWHYANVFKQGYTGEVEEEFVENVRDFIPLLLSGDSRRNEKGWTSVANLMDQQLQQKFSKTKVQSLFDSALKMIFGKIQINREQQHPDLHFFAKNELKLLKALLEGLQYQELALMVEKFRINEYVPNRKQADKLLGQNIEVFFNKVMQIAIPDHKLSISEAQREYEVLFSTHKPGSKVDRWQWDGTLVVKNDKIELYDEDGNHKDTKTIDARNFISTMHEGGVFAMPKFKVQISKILSGFEKGKDFHEKNEPRMLPGVSSFKKAKILVNAENPKKIESIKIVQDPRKIPSPVPIDTDSVSAVQTACRLISNMESHQIQNLWRNLPKTKRSMILSEHFKYDLMNESEKNDRKRKRAASEEITGSAFDIDEFLGPIGI